MNLGYSLKYPWRGETGFESKILSGKKIHTIRLNKKGRWRNGILLNHLVNSRTKNRREFLRNYCVAAEKITVAFNGSGEIARVTVGGSDILNWREIAENDGLTAADFARWFYASSSGGIFEGVIIHWTNKKYAA